MGFWSSAAGVRVMIFFLLGFLRTAKAAKIIWEDRGIVIELEAI
jgi:hypothetical protein